jgi:hypothetical protein
MPPERTSCVGDFSPTDKPLRIVSMDNSENHPTKNPRAATPSMTKMFPETKDNSQPRATPVTSPVAVNLKMFFANGCMIGQIVNE